MPAPAQWWIDPGESHSGYIADMDLFLGVYDLMALCLVGDYR